MALLRGAETGTAAAGAALAVPMAFVFSPRHAFAFLVGAALSVINFRLLWAALAMATPKTGRRFRAAALFAAKLALLFGVLWFAVFRLKLHPLALAAGFGLLLPMAAVIAIRRRG